MNGTGFHAEAFRVRVRPEIVFWSVQCVGLKGDALAVAHAHGLKQEATPFEEVATTAGRADSVVETRNDTRVHKSPCN